ncbi:hypothetical protein IGI04_042303, partial [Brassica rapa subsp. trilocularis]
MDEPFSPSCDFNQCVLVWLRAEGLVSKSLKSSKFFSLGFYRDMEQSHEDTMMGSHPGGRVPYDISPCPDELTIGYCFSGDQKYSDNLRSTIKEHQPCHFRSTTIGGEQINMGPKTRGGMVRRSRRSQGLEAETEFIEITRKSTKMRKLNKGKEVAIEEENIEIRQESADEVPTKVSEDVNEADGDGDGDDPHVEIEVENVIAEEQSQSENGVTEEPSQPREADMEAENGVTQEPSQPREADMEPENGFTQEPSQSREADMEPENG